MTTFLASAKVDLLKKQSENGFLKICAEICAGLAQSPKRDLRTDLRTDLRKPDLRTHLRNPDLRTDLRSCLGLRYFSDFHFP